MRIAMSVGHGDGLEAFVDRMGDLERAGLDQVWVGEAYGFDSATLLGYLAARTERVELGAGILNVFARPPTLIAQTAAGLDYVSGGRAVLGLGTSGPQVVEGWFGIPYDQPLRRTREVIDICRRVWRRERIVHDGAFTLPLPPDQGTGLGKPLKIAAHPVRDRIPIYVASLGPANVTLTAELADGWLPMFFIPARARTVWGEALEEGLAKRTPELGPLEVCTGAPVAIGDDVTGLRDLARPTVARYIGGMGARGRNFYNDLARRNGYEEAAAHIQDLYLAGSVAEAIAAVPDSLLEQTSLIGPSGYVKDRLAEYAEAGVTVLNVSPVGGDPVRIVEQLKEWTA